MGDDTMIMMTSHSGIMKNNKSLRFISILSILSLMYISMIAMNQHTDVLQIKDLFASMKSHTNKRRRLQTRNSKAQHINESKQLIMPNGKLMKKKNEIRKNRMKIAKLTKNDISNNNNTMIIPRAFTSWPINKELPCYPPEADWYRMYRQQTRSNEGLFYLKPYKTGSSTSSGIHLRISRNIAKSKKMITINDINQTVEVCKSRFDHGPTFYAGHTLYKNRNKERSILWTAIREPTHRSVSAFFHFAVSRLNVDANNITNFIDFLQKKIPKDYYLLALYTDHIYTREQYNPIQISNIILNEYNFIGITERMDESAVVLMMLMNLKISDILYLSAKTHGGYDDAGGGHGCTLIQKSFVSTEMKEYIDSDIWYNYIKYDLAFYNAVNQSLELTIDKLGRDKFNDNLQKFLYAKKYAVDKCLPTAIFPCDTNGKYHPPNQTDCLWKDSGCGAKCLDDVATELNLW